MDTNLPRAGIDWPFRAIVCSLRVPRVPPCETLIPCAHPGSLLYESGNVSICVSNLVSPLTVTVRPSGWEEVISGDSCGTFRVDMVFSASSQKYLQGMLILAEFGACPTVRPRR